MDAESRLNFNEAQDKISKFFFGGDNLAGYQDSYGAPPSYNAPISYNGATGYSYNRLVFVQTFWNSTLFFAFKLLSRASKRMSVLGMVTCYVNANILKKSVFSYDDYVVFDNDTPDPQQECCTQQSKSKIAESSDCRNKHKNKIPSNDIDYLIGKTVGFLNSLIGPPRRPQVICQSHSF